MERNELLKNMQLEYSSFEDRDVESMTNAIKTLFVYLEEVDVEKGWIELEKKRNKRRKFISEALGKYAGKFGYSDSYCYEMDDEYLSRRANRLDLYYGFLDGIFKEIDDNNFAEMYKLMRFTRHKNQQYRTRLECEGDFVIKTTRGEPFEMEIFTEWFSGALEKASYVERVEKVKK